MTISLNTLVRPTKEKFKDQWLEFTQELGRMRKWVTWVTKIRKMGGVRGTGRSVKDRFAVDRTV